MKKLMATLLSMLLMFSLLFVDGSFMFDVFGATPYYGLFYDEQSDGGFEYGGWSQHSISSSSKASWEIVTDEHYRGSKSAKFTFKTSPTNTKVVLKMDVPATTANEIDFIENYCWTSYIKCDSSFWGTVSLKLVNNGDYNGTGVKNIGNKDSVEVFNVKTTATDWNRVDSSLNYYSASNLETFLNGKTSLSVLLTVSAKKGTVWVDDIDFKAVSRLNEDEEVERGDNTGAAGGNYSGIFDDRTSDGGFENKAWQRADESDVRFVYDFYVYNTGKRSAGFYFESGMQETATIYTTFADLDEIAETQAHVWLANIKTTADFDGTVSLKLAAPSQVSASGILNSASTDTCIIYDSATDDASAKWASFIADEQYYSGAALTEFFYNNAEVLETEKIALVLTVTGSKGKVWVDDVNFMQRSYALGDDDSVAAGAYTGLFDSEDKNNGGFEYGIWDTVETATSITGDTKAVIDTNLKNNGSRALMMNFANGVSETFAFKANFANLSELDLTTDKFWKGFVKVADEFDGKVSLKIVAHNDPNYILLAADNSSDVVLYDSTKNGSPAAFSGLTSVKNRYTAADFKAFIENSAVAAGGFDVVLTATATKGMVWVDDIDLLDYGVISGQLNLEDPDTAYDVADDDYVGFFDEASSNGGFEHGVWALAQDYTDAEPTTNYLTDVNAKKTGKRSFNVNFSGAKEETLTFKMTSYHLAQLIDSKDYALASYIKTSVDFDGTVTFRITKTGDYATALGDKNVTMLSGNIYSYFTLNNTEAFSAAEIAAFKSALGSDTSFDVYMSVKASKGSLWVDDVNLMTTEDLEALKNQGISGTPVYDGIFENGGFEAGAWEVTEKLDTHSVTLVEEDTYNDSLRAVELTSTVAGNLKLKGATVAGKVAELDVSTPKVLAIRAKGSFTGTLNVALSNGTAAAIPLTFLNNQSFTADKWAQLMTDVFNITGEDISVVLTLNGTGSLLIDDIQILDDPDYGKLLANGGFEKGLWGSEGTGTKNIDYVVTHNSPAALKLESVAGKTFNSFCGFNSLDTTKSYKLSLSMKTVGVNYGAAYVRVLYVGGGTSRWVKWRGNEKVITTGGTSDWQTYTAIISTDDMPEWVERITIYIYIEGVGTLYADNVELTTDVSEDDFLLKQPEVEGGKYNGILYNGGFEAGAWSMFENTAGVGVTIDTENGHDGSLASLKYELPEIKNNYSQAIKTQTVTVDGSVKNFDTEWVQNADGKMETADPYCVSMYVKMSPDFEGAIYAQILQNGTKKWYNYKTEWYMLGECTSATNITETGYTGWTQLTTNMFKPTDDDEITVLIAVNGKGTIWIDDVDVIKDPNINNLISNGGFENGIWAHWGSADQDGDDIYAVKDVTCNSPKAGKLEITDYEAAGGGVYMVTSIAVGKLDRSKTYKLDFDLKYKGVESETGVQSAILQWYKVQNSDGSFQTNTDGSFKTATTWYRYYGNEQLLKMGGGDMDWTHYSLTINSSGWHENLNSASLFFYLYDEGELWIDNVKLVEKVIDGNIVAGEVTSDVPEGEVQVGERVQLYTGDSMSDIWYTVDGTDPATSETAMLYVPGEGLMITHDTTVKACTVSMDTGTGNVAEWKYTCAQGTMVEDDVQWTTSNAIFAASLDTVNKKVGNNSIKFKGGAGRYLSTGEIPIDSTFDYKLGFWVKTENLVVDNAVNFKVFLSSQAGGGDENHPIISGKRGATVGNYGKSFFSFKPDQDWTYYEMDIIDMNGLNNAVTLILYNTSSTGTVWLDGVELIAMPKDKYPVTVEYDSKVKGNIYHQNTLSNFTITQSFILKNKANCLETGVLHYDVVNDLRPDEVIQSGDIDIAVQGGGRTSSEIILGSVAEYGTFTIKYTMTNAKGAVYDVGNIQLSRVRDNTEYVEEQTSFFGVSGSVTDAGWGQVSQYVGNSIYRFDYDWEEVEKVKGEYSVDAEKDAWIDTMIDYGIEPLIIFNTHGWPSFMEDKRMPAPGWNESASDMESFLGYIKFLVETYKGKVKYFEFWNEMDYRHWANPTQFCDAKGYVSTLAKVYEVVKAANPDAVLIGGVTASTGSSGVNMGWAQTVFENEGYKYMDAYSIHPYVQLFPSPEQGEWLEDILDLKAMMDEKAGREFPLWITEMGYATARTDVQGKTPEMQMALSLRQYTMAKSIPGFQKMVTYCLGSGNSIYSTENQYGMFHHDRARPMAIARAAFNYMHDGYTCDSVVNDLNPQLYAYKFLGDKYDMYVLWADNVEYTADIVTSNDSARVYDIYSNSVYIEYNGNTFKTDVGAKLIYVRVDKGETIDSVVLTPKTNTGDDTDDSNNQNTENNSGEDWETITNTQTVVIGGDEEEVDEIIDEDEFEDDEDEEEPESENGKVKRVKKIIKKVIKGSGNGGFPWLYVIIGVAALLIIGGGTALVLILVKRKKNTQNA